MSTFLAKVLRVALMELGPRSLPFSQKILCSPIVVFLAQNKLAVNAQLL